MAEVSLTVGAYALGFVLAPDYPLYILLGHGFSWLPLENKRYGSLSSAAAQAEWYAWLEAQLAQRPLCFIEALLEVPERYQWVRQNLCWRLTQ
jgi:hypothetical protein